MNKYAIKKGKSALNSLVQHYGDNINQDKFSEVVVLVEELEHELNKKSKSIDKLLKKVNSSNICISRDLSRCERFLTCRECCEEWLKED